MRWKSTITTLLVTAAIPAAAIELSLRQAVDTALQSSPAVHAAAERARAAEARIGQAKGFRLPSVDLTASYSLTNNPAEVFALQLNQERFDMEEFFLSDPNNPDPLSNWLTRLEVTMPIYTGGELSARIGQAEHMAGAEELELGFTRERTAFDTLEAFVNLAKSRDHMALMYKSRTTTAKHVSLAESYASQGMILSAEVLKAEVHLAELDEMVAQAEKGVQLAQAALDFQMGIDQSTRHTLAPLPATPPVEGTMDEWAGSGVDRRKDLAAARRKLEAGRLEVEAGKAGFKPEVAVIGRYDLYDESFFGAQGSSGSLMAVAKINLYRGGADSARVEAARHDAASGQAEIRRFEEGIRLQVQQAWLDVITARTRHTTALSSVRSAEEALRVREHRFKQGLDKMIDLVDAETALHGSEVRELVARYDLNLATYRLYFSSGASIVDLINSLEDF